MPSVLLDQNIPRVVTSWLSERLPGWEVYHVSGLGFEGEPDDFLYTWAQGRKAVIVTYDVHFADAHMFGLGPHHGIIRLRVWPTTVESTCEALGRLLRSVPPDDWSDSLIIIDNQKIRIRRR
jgi:predicted nuclease of predicted toxin-antitoxin system